MISYASVMLMVRMYSIIKYNITFPFVSGLFQIGDWGGNALTVNNRDSLSNFLSNCPTNQECGCAKPTEPTTLPQQAPSYTGPRNYYKYADDGTRIYDWPVWAIVVAVLTSIGILVTIIITLVLLLTYPIRGGTTILGFMVLLGILGIYGINFAFFLPASFDTCAARRFCMGVIYMIVFAALLVKAVDNWRYGELSWENQKKYRGLTSACSLFMIALGIVLVQAIVPIMWLILIPPTASRVMDVNGNVADLLHDHMWCDPTDMYDIALVLSFIFVMFIVLLTSIFSAMAWDSEVNNRETRWILIACICTAGCFLVWMIVTTSAGPTYRDPAVAIANFINATALLVCIPLRKTALLIAYKRGEKLDKDDPGKNHENIILIILTIYFSNTTILFILTIYFLDKSLLISFIKYVFLSIWMTTSSTPNVLTGLLAKFSYTGETKQGNDCRGKHLIGRRFHVYPEYDGDCLTVLVTRPLLPCFN